MAFSNNQWVLAGITSSGYGCALAGYSGVYTRVSQFIPYIYSIYDSTNSQTTTASSQTATTTTPNQANFMRQSTAAILSLGFFFLIFL